MIPAKSRPSRRASLPRRTCFGGRRCWPCGSTLPTSWCRSFQTPPTQRSPDSLSIKTLNQPWRIVKISNVEVGADVIGEVSQRFVVLLLCRVQHAEISIQARLDRIRTVSGFQHGPLSLRQVLFSLDYSAKSCKRELLWSLMLSSCNWIDNTRHLCSLRLRSGMKEQARCLLDRRVRLKISATAWLLGQTGRVFPRKATSVQSFSSAQSFVSGNTQKPNPQNSYKHLLQFTCLLKTWDFRRFLSSSDVRKGTAVRSGIRSWHIFSWIPTQSDFWWSTSLNDNNWIYRYFQCFVENNKIAWTIIHSPIVSYSTLCTLNVSWLLT